MTVYQVIADVQLGKVREAPSPYMVGILSCFTVCWSGKCWHMSHIPETVLQNNLDKQTNKSSNQHWAQKVLYFPINEIKLSDSNRKYYRVSIYWHRSPGWTLRPELGMWLSLLVGRKFRAQAVQCLNRNGFIKSLKMWTWVLLLYYTNFWRDIQFYFLIFKLSKLEHCQELSEGKNSISL